MTRNRLPDRRPNVTTDRQWAGHEVTVTVGFDPETGEPRECFANVKSGGAMQALVADACIVISIALQSGKGADELAKSMCRVPAYMNGEIGSEPASAIGTILEAVMSAWSDVREAAQ